MHTKKNRARERERETTKENNKKIYDKIKRMHHQSDKTTHCSWLIKIKRWNIRQIFFVLCFSFLSVFFWLPLFLLCVLSFVFPPFKCIIPLYMYGSVLFKLHLIYISIQMLAYRCCTVPVYFLNNIHTNTASTHT